MKKKDLDRITSQVQQSLIDARVSQDVINALVFKIAKDNPSTPWWVVVLKVLAYAIGLILAGYGTTAAAATLFLG